MRFTRFGPDAVIFKDVHSSADVRIKTVNRGRFVQTDFDMIEEAVSIQIPGECGSYSGHNSHNLDIHICCRIGNIMGFGGDATLAIVIRIPRFEDYGRCIFNPEFMKVTVLAPVAYNRSDTVSEFVVTH